MKIEDTVRSSLDELARDIQPTVPDPAAVRHQVHRVNRLRAVGAVGLAAAVAGGLVYGVAQVHDNNSAPPPSNQTNNGPGPVAVVDEALWASQGVLHMGGREYPLAKQIESSLAPVKGGAVYGTRGGDVVYQPGDGEATVIATDAVWGALPDPESHAVAWLVRDSGAFNLVLKDVVADRQIGVVRLAGLSLRGHAGFKSPESPLDWVGCDDDGGCTVLFKAEGDEWRYDVDSSGDGAVTEAGPVPFDAAGTVFARTADGQTMAFETPEGDPISSFSPLEADGGLSHDGRYFAGYSDGGLAFVDTETGEVEMADLGVLVVPFDITWSAGHTLMMYTPDLGGSPSSADDPAVDLPGSLIACDADTLRCETVARLDEMFEADLPMP